jgi:hypothetical protein
MLFLGTNCLTEAHFMVNHASLKPEQHRSKDIGIGPQNNEKIRRKEGCPEFASGDAEGSGPEGGARDRSKSSGSQGDGEDRLKNKQDRIREEHREKAPS